MTTTLIDLDESQRRTEELESRRVTLSEKLGELAAERGTLLGRVHLGEETPDRLTAHDATLSEAQHESDQVISALALLRSRYENDLSEAKAAHLDALRAEDRALLAAHQKAVRRLDSLEAGLSDLNGEYETRESRSRAIYAELTAADPERSAAVSAAYAADVQQVEEQFVSDLQEADRETDRALAAIRASHPYDSPADYMMGTDIEVSERGQPVTLVNAPVNASRAIGIVSQWRVTRWDEAGRVRRAALTDAATHWAAASRDAGLGSPPGLSDANWDRVLDSHQDTWLGLRPPALREVFVGAADHMPEQPAARYRNDPLRWGLEGRRLAAEKATLRRLAGP